MSAHLNLHIKDLRVATEVVRYNGSVDTGLAWTLQGHYGRTAHGLIEAGLVVAR